MAKFNNDELIIEIIIRLLRVLFNFLKLGNSAAKLYQDTDTNRNTERETFASRSRCVYMLSVHVGVLVLVDDFVNSSDEI